MRSDSTWRIRSTLLYLFNFKSVAPFLQKLKEEKFKIHVLKSFLLKSTDIFIFLVALTRDPM